MKTGTKHWLMVRLTSLPLVFLFFYFISQVEYLTTRSRMEFISWVKQPGATISILLFIICGFYHACLGVDEIIEDYVSTKVRRIPSLLANRIFFLGLGIAAVYATLAISFGTF